MDDVLCGMHALPPKNNRADDGTPESLLSQRITPICPRAAQGLHLRLKPSSRLTFCVERKSESASQKLRSAFSSLRLVHRSFVTRHAPAKKITTRPDLWISAQVAISTPQEGSLGQRSLGKRPRNQRNKRCSRSRQPGGGFAQD